MLNGLVKGARDIISGVVESKVKEQIVQQIEEGLANVNSYLASNPDLLLNCLEFQSTTSRSMLFTFNFWYYSALGCNDNAYKTFFIYRI